VDGRRDMGSLGFVATLFVFWCISTVVLEGACVRDCRELGMCMVGTSRLVSRWRVDRREGYYGDSLRKDRRGIKKIVMVKLIIQTKIRYSNNKNFSLFS
jgi:hypothetical protein